MEKIINDALIDLGLTEKDIRFFLANYIMGPSPINDIAKKAKLERSTAYLIAQDLINKGFILEDFKQYKKLLTTIEPNILLRMLATKQRKIGRHELAFQEKLPELQALHQASEIRPRVKTYDGNQGLIAIWRDILSETQEVLLWTNQKSESKLFSEKYHAMFIRERLKKNIQMRVLAVQNKKGQLLLMNDKKSLRKTKLLPKEANFSAETYIYGNKVAILDYNKDIIGIIIESEQIVQSHRAIFEMTWKRLR